MSIGFDEIQLEKTTVGSIVTLVVKGRLDKEDYEAFVPQLDWLIEKNGAIRLLIELVDFQGWTVGAMWEDTKFAFKHFSDIDKLALVGGKQWEKRMSKFIAPFTKAKVRYFDISEKESALSWLAS